VLSAAAALLLAPALLSNSPAQASDHADTAENVSRPGADLTVVYIFPSANSDKKVVLVMNARPLIPSGEGRMASFDPGVLYQFKIDNTGDSVEDLVIQARFVGTGPTQRFLISSPSAPPQVGTTTTLLPQLRPGFLGLPGLGSGSGNANPGLPGLGSEFSGLVPPGFLYARAPRINQQAAVNGMRVFAGAREDPFFFDLERFTLNQVTQEIFPDRRTPLEPPLPRTEDKTIPNPNTPLVASWRPPGEARDFLAGFNVLSIVVELPRKALGGGVIRLWETTSVSNDGVTFVQQDRLARPIVNEALATVSNNRHKINNRNNPTDDPNELANDIESFLTFPANRSRAIKDVIKAVLIPDVMIADLSKSGPASYLGVETNGATGGLFGGRALTDDVVDISLNIVFGTTISDLGLAPADGNEIPALTSDNVGPEAKHFKDKFPYLGDPQ
jgi:hypothetical protein